MDQAVAIEPAHTHTQVSRHDAEGDETHTDELPREIHEARECKQRFFPASPEQQDEQKKLYDQYIFPYEAEIYFFLSRLRREIDRTYYREAVQAIWENRDIPVSPHTYRDIRKYPAGFCAPIVVTARDTLEKLPMVRDFIKAGGLFGLDYRVYAPDGVSKGFANVIRIGHKIIDPTSDEYSKSHQSIDIQIDDEKTYRFIDFEGFITTAKRYWGDTLYSSISLFGVEFARYFPFVSIDESGKITDFPALPPRLLLEMLETQGESFRSYFQSHPELLQDPPPEVVTRFGRQCEYALREGIPECIQPIIPNKERLEESLRFFSQAFGKKQSTDMVQDPWKYPDVFHSDVSTLSSIGSGFYDYIVRPVVNLYHYKVDE